MKYLLTVFLLYFFHQCPAQDENSAVDQIFLENGTILLGKIIFEDDQLLKLNLQASDEIISIKQGRVTKIIKNQGRFYFYQKGKYDYLKDSYIQLSLGAGFGSVGSSYLNLQITKRVTPRFSMGPGLGLLSLTTLEQFISYQFVDVYAHGRYYLSKFRKPNKWYLGGKLGYALPFGKDRLGSFSYSGGPMAETAFGLHWSSKRKTKCSLELAYRVQPSRGKNENIRRIFQFNIDQGARGSEVRIFLRSLVRFNVELN